MGSFSERYLRNFPIALVRRDGEPVRLRKSVAVGLARGGGRGSDALQPRCAAPGPWTFPVRGTGCCGARQEGFSWFSLGVATPGGALGATPLAPAWHRIGNFIFRHGEHFYNFEGLLPLQGQVPSTWEPKYLVAPGGVGLPLILVDVSVLIAAGSRNFSSNSAGGLT